VVIPTAPSPPTLQQLKLALKQWGAPHRTTWNTAEDPHPVEPLANPTHKINPNQRLDLDHSAIIAERAIATDTDRRQQVDPHHKQPWWQHLMLAPQAWKGGMLEWLTSPTGPTPYQVAWELTRARLTHSHLADNQPTTDDRLFCVIDPAGQFCPWQAIAAGLNPKRLLVVRPSTTKEVWWATEQILRSPAVAVAWCWADSLSTTVLRRWKLAVEQGGGIAMLFRPDRVAREPSWADMRWLITEQTPQQEANTSIHTANVTRLRLELLSCRGGFGGKQFNWELLDDADAIPVVSELAHSTSLANRSCTAQTVTRPGDRGSGEGTTSRHLLPAC
jgi:hypothetical protein